MNWAAIVWLILLVVFLVVEASTITMVSLWFGAGALAAMLVSMLKAPLWLQITTFLVVSGGALALLRPLARKHFTPRLVKTNVDSVIGSQGLVTVAIDNVAAVGQVKLGGMEWTARSTGGEPIPEGTRIRVDRIEGVKAYVSPAEAKVEV